MALVVEIPEPLPKSKIRASGPGMPALDLAYRAWRDRLIDEANRRWLDAHWPGLPAANLVERPGLDEALFLATGGSRMFWSESETWNHRTRWLAVELRDHPRKLLALALRYFDALREAQR
jgi:hypothetical protein